MIEASAPDQSISQSAWWNECRASFRLAWPLICTNLAMSAIGASDVVMIGWLGAQDLAAASIGQNLYLFFAILSMGFITASSPMMATMLGKKWNSVRDVRRTFRQSLWMAFAIAICVWGILWNSEYILLFMGQADVLAQKAQVYLRIFMFSLLPYLWVLATRNFLSAIEQPLWSLIIAIVGVLMNIIFNYALIFGNFGMPRLELVGAGLGSILANSFMFLFMLAIIKLHKDFRRYHLFGRWWRSDWPRFLEMWRLGLPIGITFGLEGGVFSVAALLMGWISIEAVAAHAVALQIAALSFMVPMGLAQSATVRVGIGYGRNDNAMIMRAGWFNFVMGVGFMAVMACVLIIFPQQLVSLFLDVSRPENSQVIVLAVQFLMLAAAFQIVDGAQVVGQGMLRGLHDTRVPMWIAAFGYWGVGIGVSYYLAFHAGWGGVGIWTGLAIGLGVVAILMIARWLMRDKLALLPTP